MAFSSPTEIILKNLYISPRKGGSLNEQISDCYNQFEESPDLKIYPKSLIVKQTIFLTVSNNSEYFQSKQKLFACAKDFFELVPPTSIVTQSPENGSLSLELTLIEGLKPEETELRKNASSSWIRISRGNTKMIIATGFGNDAETGNILQQSATAFTQIQNILNAEEMEFSDIVRQWNYIEQITRNVNQNNTISQHYQIFNDIRSKFYQQASFVNGFPSATGIGMNCGGIIIDIIAVNNTIENSIVAIKSPVQLDAYTYSKEVLAENNTITDFCRTTPKFERAKILVYPDNKLIFISGTAAIKGQVSIPVISVEQQTEMTIQNILSLISRENLKKHGIQTSIEASICNLRVYVKFRKDVRKAKGICEKYFPGIPALFVIADICRPELLVEIEGQAVCR
jgi:enamine deaminase RidA (YjgF/YER057c/UK114 family)